MNFRDKLRQEEILKKKNETQLNLLVPGSQPLIRTEAEWISSNGLRTPEELLRKALAKRPKRQSETTKNADELLPDRDRSASILGGRSLSNDFGSCVYRIEQSGPSCHDLKASHADLVSKITGLVFLLQKETSLSELGQVVFLDTETTGLSGGTGTYAFLVGIGSWNGSIFAVEQFFMRDFHEEPALLHALEERLKPVQLLITFNGKSFDIPLLKSRFTLARRAWPLVSASHLDLLFPARRIWKLRLGDCRLGNLEKEILGDARTEDVAGNLIPQIYFNYVRSGNPVGIRKILEHNSRDIVSLAKLTLKVSEILHGKERATLFPEDLYSVGNYFNQLGERETATAWNQAALRFPLQMDLRLGAMKNLAASYKSRRLFLQAVELWNTLIEESASFQEEAYESLSIHYEHREKNLAKALLLTEKAISQVRRETARIRWMRRRDRLLRKIQKEPGLSQFAISDPLC
jgi:uncharacterized protein YprB with RNaseH-like and TPR domain